MASGLSLAGKCQLVFGAAVVAIIAGSLAVPWVRMGEMVDEGQREMSRQLAETWVQNGFQLMRTEGTPIPIRVVPADRLEDGEERDPFAVEAWRALSADPGLVDYAEAADTGSGTVYRYALAIPDSQWRAIQDRRFLDFSPRASDAGVSDPPRALVIIERESAFASRQEALNRMWLLGSLAVASLLAVAVFWLILTKLVFSPVRRLRATAERVQRGDLSARSALRTRDDFEQLSRAFDGMLAQMQQVQESLRSANESLDVRIAELAESNVGLAESSRLKSEFLANVSHELRTPLNSIIGFADLLREIAEADVAADPKRIRYITNILTSARGLLDMINELLDMAKIEAGRVEVAVRSTSVADIVEGLVRLMQPQCQAKSIEVALDIGEDLPAVETDPGKLQQILYNFLSNAVKFSPNGAAVTLAASRTEQHQGRTAVRISVSDRGPGVPADMQDVIFEKFRQVDASHTKRHGGTGLGLAICRELAEMLGATLSLRSAPGAGSTFSVEVPVAWTVRQRKPLLPAAGASATMRN